MSDMPIEQKRYFEDFEVGDSATSRVARTLSEHDLYTVCGLYGTFSELHLNRPKMDDSSWGGRLFPGVGLSVIMLGLHHRVPWDPESRGLYGFDRVRYVEPVRVDDTVYLDAEVLELDEREDDPGRGLIRQREDLLRTEDGETEDGELVATRERLYLCAQRP
jgi:acyl dehydratase